MATSVYVYMYICMYICMYVCMYVSARVSKIIFVNNLQLQSHESDINLVSKGFASLYQTDPKQIIRCKTIIMTFLSQYTPRWSFSCLLVVGESDELPTVPC